MRIVNSIVFMSLMIVMLASSAIAVNISVVSPVNNTQVVDVNTNFTFNVSGSAGEVCSLYLDESVEDTLTLSGDGQYVMSNASYLQSINNDGVDHSWYVNCTGVTTGMLNFTVKDDAYHYLVKGCREFNDNGTYYLDGDRSVAGSFSGCWFLNAEDVVIDLQGYTFNIPNNGRNLFLRNENTTKYAIIKNGKLKISGGLGIQYKPSQYVKFINVTIPNYGMGYVSYYKLKYVQFINSSITESRIFTYASSRSDVEFINSDVLLGSSLVGALTGPTNIKFINSTVRTGVVDAYGGTGYIVLNGSSNSIMTFTGVDVNFSMLHGGVGTTISNGTNLLGGEKIGGLAWNATASNVSSLDCFDANADGLCDEDFTIGNVIDSSAMRIPRIIFAGAPNVTSPVENDAVRGTNVTVNVVLDDVNYENTTIGVGTVTEAPVYDGSVLRDNSGDSRIGQSFTATGDQLVDIKRYWDQDMSGDVNGFVLFKGRTITGTPIAHRDSSADLRTHPIEIVKGQEYTFYSDVFLSFTYLAYNDPYSGGCAFYDGSLRCDFDLALDFVVRDHNILSNGTALENVVPDRELGCSSGGGFTGGSFWEVFFEAQEPMYISTISWKPVSSVSGVKNVTKYINCTAPNAVNCTTVIDEEYVDLSFNKWSSVSFEKYVAAGEIFGIEGGSLAGSGTKIDSGGCELNTTIHYVSGNKMVRVDAARVKKNMSYIVPVSAGDEVLNVGARDVSGEGSTNWTSINLRVSNLGTIENLSTDKLAYWTVEEYPQVLWNMTSIEGYGDINYTVRVKNGSTVIAEGSRVGDGCLQETANANVNGCGEETGSYKDVVPVTWKGIMYINYTKPVGVVGAVSQYKMGVGGIENTTVPQACFDADVATLRMRVFWDYFDVSLQCFNGAGYQTIATSHVPSGSGSKSGSQTTAVIARDGDYDSSICFGNSATTWASSCTGVNAYARFYDEAIIWTFEGLAVTVPSNVSYEFATVELIVNDTLFSENDTVTGIVLDAMSQPVITVPTTTQHGSYNVTWNTSTKNLGIVNYTVQVSHDGGAFSLVNTTTDTYLQITPTVDETVLYQVKAEDTYVNTTYNNGSSFNIILNPNITSEVCAALTYPNEDDKPVVATVPVNFSVYAPVGFSSPVVTVTLSYGGEEYAGTCDYVQNDVYNREYNCTVSMSYWYAPGDYTLNVTYVDGSKSDSVVQSGACTYGQLVASKTTTSYAGFSDAAPGVENARSDDPVNIRNTGNVDLDLKMTAYDLSGRSTPATKLGASTFKAGELLGSAVTLADATQKNLSVSLSYGENANADIYLWLSMPLNQLVQDYYAATPWQLTGVGN